jgi:hypothetical protein
MTVESIFVAFLRARFPRNKFKHRLTTYVIFLLCGAGIVWALSSVLLYNFFKLPALTFVIMYVPMFIFYGCALLLQANRQRFDQWDT